MATLIQTLASVIAAGSMLFSAPVDVAAPQHDIDGDLFLINRQWRVSENFVPELRSADVSGQLKQMRPDATYALEEMFKACKKESGGTMQTVSGYRSYTKQSNLYNNKLKRVKGSVEKADEYVARPGASEHQLGLAMDIGQVNKTNLTSGFGKTKSGKWLAANGWRYGFILRYQEGWEEITGYNFEPWHVRYVGKEHAEKIQQANIPLETYLVEYRSEMLMDIVTGKILEDE